MSRMLATLGEAPSKTQLLIYFQIHQAPRMISKFSPFCTSPVSCCYCFWEDSAYVQIITGLFPWDPGACTDAAQSCRWCPLFQSQRNKIKMSLFQVKSNKINRDVKGLFLGLRIMSSRVIISWLSCSSRPYGPARQAH
jgi:hypothetical protein